MAESSKDRFNHLLEGVDTAMLVSFTSSGDVHARPMAVARVEDTGAVWFCTGAETGKVVEIQQNPSVGLTFQDGRRFLSVSGTARLVQDRALIREMWKEPWRVWFPDGPETADLVLVQVEVRDGEYWDDTGTKGIAFLFDAARSYLTGTRPRAEDEPKQHGTVTFQG
jgi:general stress protein 26